jgi:uncharacterized protein YbjT (DUF2867 family)
VRPGSEGGLPAGCTAIIGNALDGDSYASEISPADTFVQLVGVSHPSPSKASQFRSVDLVSAQGAIHGAVRSGIQNFVYLSVAQPAPVMKAYVEIRRECEAMLRNTSMNVTIVRPWGVLGPGHRWPYFLVPIYWLMERVPIAREGARRLGLVTREQMTRTLVHAVENPSAVARIIEVPEIRALSALA